VDGFWIVLIAIAAVVAVIALARLVFAGGSRRDPGRVMPEGEEPPRR
jgi:uncharacterized membrane protein